MRSISTVLAPQHKVTRPELARLTNDLFDQNSNPSGYVLTRGHYALMLGMLSAGEDLDVDAAFQAASQGIESCGGIVNMTELEALVDEAPEPPDPDTSVDPEQLLLNWLDAVGEGAWATHLLFGNQVLVTDKFGGSFAYGEK